MYRPRWALLAYWYLIGTRWTNSLSVFSNWDRTDFHTNVNHLFHSFSVSFSLFVCPFLHCSCAHINFRAHGFYCIAIFWLYFSVLKTCENYFQASLSGWRSVRVHLSKYNTRTPSVFEFCLVTSLISLHAMCLLLWC